MHTTTPTLDLTLDHIDAEFARIVDELTRRGLLTGGVSVAAALGLAACGSSPSGTTTTATRAVGSAKGTITVPMHPTRVVSIDWFVNNTLYDLGVNPIGVQDPGAQYVAPRYRSRWDTESKVNSAGSGIAVEKVAALQPDLIIGTAGAAVSSSLYRQLSAIAPTVLAVASPWQDMTQTIAEATNQAAALKKLKAKLAARYTGIKATYADVLGRTHWDLLQGGFDQGQFYCYGPNSLIGLVLADAGVEFADASENSASAKSPGVGIRSVSYENIDQLRDADVIAYYATTDGTPQNLGPRLFAQQLWKNLPAVKAGRVVPIADFLVGGYGDALAVLDELEAGLKKLQENR